MSDLDLQEMADKMVQELLKVNPSDEAGKNSFFNMISEFEDMQFCLKRVFKKYCVLNPESEFIKEQIELLKQQYEAETKADRFFEVDEDVNYLKEFQDFDKPPIIPEQVAQTEFYRPNPAAFQKRINDNPYAVDVGFSSLQNPIYSKLDDFPNLLNPRANSQFYNPQDMMNNRVEYKDPVKPFSQKLNSVILEKAQEKDKRGTLDELILKAGILGQSNQNNGNSPFGVSRPNNFMFGSYQPSSSNTNSMNQASKYYQLYDFVKDPENVKLVY